MKLLLLIHIFATVFMVGLIWFVQIVHYPLFASVGADGFRAYEEQHQRLTTWVVAPVMLVELLTSTWLWKTAPPHLSVCCSAGLALLGLIWLTTAFLSVPAHNALSEGFSETAYRKLVATNWIRTIAWSIRGVLVLIMVRLEFTIQAST